MKIIKKLTLSFPDGVSINDCQEIVQFAEKQTNSGVKEGGMSPINKYGMNVENMTFSEDEMHYIYGHLNMVKEKCYACGSYAFSVVRDMTSRRVCRCGHSWECPK